LGSGGWSPEGLSQFGFNDVSLLASTIAFTASLPETNLQSPTSNLGTAGVT